MRQCIGIHSIGRSRVVAPDGNWRSDVALLGILFDMAVGFRPGARLAPRAMREASLRFSLGLAGSNDLREGCSRLAGVKICDAADVDLPTLEPELARALIGEAKREIRAKRRLPVFLGGHHSVKYPILRAFDEVANLEIVLIDAHLDSTPARSAS